jgi:hypothetical protein
MWCHKCHRACAPARRARTPLRVVRAALCVRVPRAGHASWGHPAFTSRMHPEPCLEARALAARGTPRCSPLGPSRAVCRQGAARAPPQSGPFLTSSCFEAKPPWPHTLLTAYKWRRMSSSRAGASVMQPLPPRSWAPAPLTLSAVWPPLPLLYDLLALAPSLVALDTPPLHRNSSRRHLAPLRRLTGAVPTPTPATGSPAVSS